MFGSSNNAFGQSSQQPSAFGQPQQPQTQPQSAFGGFGQTSAFGQPQQQNTAFGQPQQNQAASAFGAFGQPKPGFGAAGSTFGQPSQPTAGFGFGGASTTNNAFGTSTTNTTSGLFGRPATSTGAFGASTAPAAAGSTSIFGAAKPPATGFGVNIGTANNGTASPAYQVTSERESPTSTSMSNYQAITAMPAYKAFSFEELRIQDYSAGRKTASAAGFGQSTGFGATAGAPPTAGFGGTGAFGQTSNTATGAFGATQPTTSVFGGASTTQPATGFGAFGQTNPTNTAGGVFGQQNQPATSAFGQTAGTSTFGGFGQQNQQQQQQQQQPQQPGSAFGQSVFGQNAQSKPFGAFGQTAQPTSTFGGFGQTSTTAAPSAFGQQQQQQQQPQQPQTGAFGGGFGAFGANNASNAPKPLFGASTTAPQTNVFGQAQPAQQTAPTFGGGLFGQNAQQPQQQAQQQPSTGLFGQTQNQQPATQPTGGLFSGSSLFGQNNQQNQQQQNPAPAAPTFGSTGLFAPKPTNPPTSGLFGSTAAQPAQGQATTSLFGNTQQNQAQPSTGLFGNSAQPSLFGQQPQQQNQQTSLFGANNNNTMGTSSLFGNKPAQPGLFGSAQPQQTMQNQQTSLFGSTGGIGATSLFGQSALGGGLGGMNQGAAQGSLTATIDGNVFGNQNFPTANGATGGAAASVIHLNDPDKNKSHVQYNKRYMPKAAAPKIGKLRGFSTPPPQGTPPLNTSFSSSGGFGSSMASSGGSPFARPSSANSTRIGTSLGGLSESASSSTLGGGLGPEAFRSRQSVKKLVLPSRVDPHSWADSIEANRVIANELGGSTGGGGTSPGPKNKVTWDPQLGVTARESVGMSPSASGSHFATTTPTRTPKSILPPTTTPTDTPSKSALKSKSGVTSGTTSSKKTDISKLQPGEYWSNPSIAELQDLGFMTLSQVENFTVGRIGYGKVTFLERVNLTTVQAITEIFGKVILFDERECTVYPDERDKPPMGEGLNVPARIELEGCWPMDRAKREPIRDENHPRLKAHITRLTSIPNTKFIDYDTKTGVWIFEVPHFTRYGLDEDEDEDDESSSEFDVESVIQQTTTPLGSPVKRRVPQKGASYLTIDDQMTEDGEEEQDSHRSMSSASASPALVAEVDEGSEDEYEEGSYRPSPSHDEASEHSEEELDDTTAGGYGSRPWPATLGLDPKRVNVMQASFFHSQPDTEDSLPTGRPLGVTSGLAGDLGVSGSFGVVGSGTLGRDFLLGQEASRQQDKPENVMPMPAPPVMRDPSIGQYAQSVASRHEGHFVDAGLALARSFRVGWGPGGMLAFCGKLCGANDLPDKEQKVTTVAVQHVRMFSGDEASEREASKRLMDFHMPNSTIEVDENNTPVADAAENIRFRHIRDLYPGDDLSHEASMWKLASALFDEIDFKLSPDTPPDIQQTVSVLRRKTALSDWLEHAVSGSVESDLRQDAQASGARRTFIMLSGNQIDRACEVAMDGGNLNLAMLIAQAGGDERFRLDLQSQLEVWKEQNVEPFVDESYRKVLAILSGIVDVLPGSKDSDNRQKSLDLKLADKLDWKRAFGLQLWYGTFLQDPIDEAFSSYTELWQQRNGLSSSPVPWYIEKQDPKSNLVRWKGGDHELFDGMYELIRLAVDRNAPLESVLRPAGFTPSPLDYRHIWHLYVVLSKVLKYRDFGDRAEYGMSDSGENRIGTSHIAQHVTLSYASQLEYLGLKEDAIFVLLHLELVEGRKRAIKDLLSRHTGEWSTSFLEFLVNQLCVPREWIAEAMAILAMYERRYFDAYQYFLESGDQSGAHNVAVKYLAPEIVIRGDMKLLLKVFSIFDPSEVDDWRTRGKNYFDYAQCCIRIPELLQSAVADEGAPPDAAERKKLEEYSQTVGHLLHHLPDILREDDLKQKVCLGEMLATLMKLNDSLTMFGVSHRQRIQSNLVLEQARLRHIQSTSHDRFLKALEVASAA